MKVFFKNDNLELTGEDVFPGQYDNNCVLVYNDNYSYNVYDLADGQHIIIINSPQHGGNALILSDQEYKKILCNPYNPAENIKLDVVSPSTIEDNVYKRYKKYNNIFYNHFTGDIMINKKILSDLEKLKFLLVEEYCGKDENSIIAHYRRPLRVYTIMGNDGHMDGYVLSLWGSPSKAKYYFNMNSYAAAIIDLSTGKKYSEASFFYKSVSPYLNNINLRMHQKFPYELQESDIVKTYSCVL